MRRFTCACANGTICLSLSQNYKFFFGNIIDLESNKTSPSEVYKSEVVTPTIEENKVIMTNDNPKMQSWDLPPELQNPL